MRTLKLVLVALLAGFALIGASLTSSGCSSKPAFCSDLDQLEQSIKGISEIDLKSNPQAALENQITEIETDAKATFQAAEQDFPTESREVETAVEELGQTVDELPSSPDNQQLLGVAGRIATLASALKGFSEATKSACD